MKYLTLPNDKPRILAFYLAMEEFAARYLNEEEIFFTWVVSPTVICGRNQLIENEVNLQYCRDKGVAVFRRKSGGGAVYADNDNIMFSYITHSDNVTTTYSRYTQAVVTMLRALGLNASDNSRNDILVDGLKVSGNAFYHLPGRSIVHGTMLFDADLDHIASALTPSRAKLESKGIKSVSSRVTMLHKYLPQMTVESFREHVARTMTDGEIRLTEADVAQIEAIMQTYLDPDFLWGKNPQATFRKAVRIEGVGEMSLAVELRRSVIANIYLTGDFFLLGDLDGEIIARLRGLPPERSALEQALAPVDVSLIIKNLTNDQLINLFITD